MNNSPGWIAWVKNPELNSPPTILQGSHLLHGEFKKVFQDVLPLNDDWHVLTPEQIQWYKDKGCQDICIICPAGSQVCWDRLED